MWHQSVSPQSVVGIVSSGVDLVTCTGLKTRLYIPSSKTIVVRGKGVVRAFFLRISTDLKVHSCCARVYFFLTWPMAIFRLENPQCRVVFFFFFISFRVNHCTLCFVDSMTTRNEYIYTQFYNLILKTRFRLNVQWHVFMILNFLARNDTLHGAS